MGRLEERLVCVVVVLGILTTLSVVVSDFAAQEKEPQESAFARSSLDEGAPAAPGIPSANATTPPSCPSGPPSASC